MLLLGTTDGFANIHAPNERVLIDEFEKAVLAEAEFFGTYAEALRAREDVRERRRRRDAGRQPKRTFMRAHPRRRSSAVGNKMPRPGDPVRLAVRAA